MDNVIRAFQKLREFYKLKINPQWKDAQIKSLKGQIRNELSTLGLWLKFRSKWYSKSIKRENINIEWKKLKEIEWEETKYV